MQATIDEIFENEEILEHIEIVHSLHENPRHMHFERKIVTKTTLSPKYLRGRGVTLAETKRKTIVTSMSSIARSRDSSIDVTPSVFIRTHSYAQIASSLACKHGNSLAHVGI